jgi:hypothetical protein
MSRVRLVRRLGAATAAAALAVVGFTASPAHADDYVDAILPNGQHVPCGLSEYGPVGPDSNGMFTWYDTVGNCHTYGVWRAVVYKDRSFGSGPCYYYPPHRAYDLGGFNASGDYLKSC